MWRLALGVVSTFCHHVVCVFFGGSSKKMIGIHAASIVTAMKCPKPIGQRAIMQFVGKAMCERGLAIDADLAVFMASATSLPFPTFIRAAFINFLPESVDSRKANMMVMDKSPVLSLKNPLPFHGAGGDWCELTAAAHTKPARVGAKIAECELGAGRCWGMLAHVVSPFVTIGQSRGRLQRRSAISIGVLPVYFSTFSLLQQSAYVYGIE